MKWIFDRCRRQRQDICLLASALLSDSDRTRVENHLATCAGCRSYFDQIKTVTVPLTGWEKHFAQIEPGVAVHTPLAQVIAPTDKSESKRRLMPGRVLFAGWQQLIWPSRRIWAGLTAVWLLMLMVNFSIRDRSPANAGKSAPMPEMLLSFPQQEKLLAELIGPNETRAAPPPKPFSPQPRSQRRFENLMT